MFKIRAVGEKQSGLVGRVKGIPLNRYMAVPFHELHKMKSAAKLNHQSQFAAVLLTEYTMVSVPKTAMIWMLLQPSFEFVVGRVLWAFLANHRLNEIIFLPGNIACSCLLPFVRFTCICV